MNICTSLFIFPTQKDIFERLVKEQHELFRRKLFAVLRHAQAIHGRSAFRVLRKTVEKQQPHFPRQALRVLNQGMYSFFLSIGDNV